MTSTTRPPLWPLLLFTGMVAFLLQPVAGANVNTGVRIGGAGAALGMLAGLAGGIRSTRRDHLDDDAMPSLVALARESTAKFGRGFIYVAGYFVVIALAVGSDTREDPGANGAALAVVAAALVVATLLEGVRITRRAGGVELDVFYRSTSCAFFVTVLGAVAYALFEAFVDAPKLSMWLVWSFGMVAWMVSSAVLAKRVS